MAPGSRPACGSGVGATIAANNVTGVRAGLIQDVFSAHHGVEDDDMNVFALGGGVIGVELARELIRAFLNARFSGAERHRRRIAKVEALAARFPENVRATVGGRSEAFADGRLGRSPNATDRRSRSSLVQSPMDERIDNQIADFPFVAHVLNKRYELYGDGTFNAEDIAVSA